jgi:hypothetical protein
MTEKSKKIILFSTIGWAFFMSIISLNLVNRVIALEINQSFDDGDIRSAIQRLSEDVHRLKTNE